MLSDSRTTGEPDAGPLASSEAVRPYTRWLGIALIPFLVAAWILLYVLPGTTNLLFAWTIAPSLSAMLLASAYVGGIWFFVLVARARQWKTVRRGFPAVLTFASLALVATILHWDRFHFGHISFVTWVILYISAPFLVAAAILLQRGSDSDSDTGSDRSGHRGSDRPTEYGIPAWQRVLLAIVGIAASATGIVLFIAPALLIDTWAWQLTPLTARITGAILTLPGMVNVWMLVDRRWSAFRGIFQAQLVSLAFILLALVLARGDLDWARPLTPVVVGGFVVSAAAYVAFYVSNEKGSSRAQTRNATP